jgi:hypothetical protein
MILKSLELNQLAFFFILLSFVFKVIKPVKNCPMFKLFIIAAFILIIYNLGSALFHLVSSKGNSKKLIKALALRVSFSILIFLSILLAYYLGFIEYTGVPV